MLNQITLACFTQGHFEQFINKETWAICELYCSLLNKYNTSKVVKCVINIRSDWADLNNYYKNYYDVISLYKYFDFENYLKVNNYSKKKMQLDAVHNGMMEIASYELWETDPLLDAYNGCIEKELKYQFFVGKPAYSPNKKHYIRLWCNWDIDIFEVLWILYNKNGIEVKREKFIEKQPFEGEFIYYSKSKWISENEVEFWSTYKYGDQKKYLIKVQI